MATRKELIESLYDAQPSLFPDLRHLDTMPLLEQRLCAVARQLRDPPQALSGRERECLKMERSLLKHKLALYLHGPRPARRRALCMRTPYLTVRATEYRVARQFRQITRRDAPREKRTQTLVLLHTMLIGSSPAQLERAVQRFQQRL